MNARTSSSARDHAMPLPTMTSGRSAVRSAASAAATSLSAAWLRGGGGIVAAARHLVLVDAAEDDVVGHVEVRRAGPAVPGRAHRLLDVERDPVGALDDVAVLRERRRRQHLALLLERAHAVLVDAAGAADEDHRPVVLLGVGEAGQGVDHAGTADDEARLRADRAGSRRPAWRTTPPARCASR